MNIGILAAGITPDELLNQYGTYADMFVQLLGPDNPEFEFSVYEACNGILPDSVHACDGWIVTGSKFSVYEDIDWIHNLRNFVADAANSGLPMVGICFGHQLIAEALGGRVHKNPGGWGLGVHEYHPTDAFANQLGLPQGQTMKVNAVHQDQVVKLPEGADVIACSDFCPVAGLSYFGGRVVTLQPHPEFSLAFEADLLENRKGIAFTEADANAGIESASADNASIDSANIARWMASVFTAHRNT